MNARFTGRWLAGLAAGAAVGVLATPLALRAFVGGVDLLLQGCVSLAVAFSAGASGWAIARSAAGSLIVGLATPKVSGALAALVAVAVAALWGLMRLLGIEGE